MGTGISNQNDLTEEALKRAILNHLQGQNWQVQIAWRNSPGADIVAIRAAEKWIIEVKGIGSRSQMQNNYFVSILGELLQRMNDSNAKYSIALPDAPKYRRLWKELPQLAKGRLGITALFVDAAGQIVEVG